MRRAGRPRRVGRGRARCPPPRRPGRSRSRPSPRQPDPSRPSLLPPNQCRPSEPSPPMSRSRPTGRSRRMCRYPPRLHPTLHRPNRPNRPNRPSPNPCRLATRRARAPSKGRRVTRRSSATPDDLAPAARAVAKEASPEGTIVGAGMNGGRAVSVHAAGGVGATSRSIAMSMSDRSQPVIRHA